MAGCRGGMDGVAKWAREEVGGESRVRLKLGFPKADVGLK